MKVTVIEMFQDKNTGEYYDKGQMIEISDSKRVDELASAKVVEVTAKPETTSKARGKKNDKPGEELC